MKHVPKYLMPRSNAAAAAAISGESLPAITKRNRVLYLSVKTLHADEAVEEVAEEVDLVEEVKRNLTRSRSLVDKCDFFSRFLFVYSYMIHISVCKAKITKLSLKAYAHHKPMLKLIEANDHFLRNLHFYLERDGV